LCPEGLVPGVAVPGLAPGSRELEMMRSQNAVPEIHGICLTGGSSFGLAAASGIARYLSQNGYGLKTPGVPLPIVPAAVIFDLLTNEQPGVLPDENMGFEAAQAANTDPVLSGRFGAGTGAACGHLSAQLHPTGLGSAGIQYKEAQVAALIVNNALGNIYHPLTGQFLSGALDENGQPLSQEATMEALYRGALGYNQNTMLALVATNAKLNKGAANRIAGMAYAGISRAVRPSNLMFDGDVVFMLGQKKGPAVNQNLLGHMAAQAVSMAIVNSVSTP
jgi:L-aminopeptidase/D-esterase-like protein